MVAPLADDTSFIGNQSLEMNDEHYGSETIINEQQQQQQQLLVRAGTDRTTCQEGHKFSPPAGSRVKVSPPSVSRVPSGSPPSVSRVPSGLPCER